jgi:tRNA (cytidine/uridine-2'-O-)-methyltransferase
MKHPHLRRHDLPFRWPDPPFSVALVRPEIPPNTGNIARLCAATGTPLHLIGPMGFRLSDKSLKRAGLDYWDAVEMHTHGDWDDFRKALPLPAERVHLFSTSGERSVFDVQFHPGDLLIFGGESIGLPDPILREFPDRMVGIPMCAGDVRSLNLATSVGIALYEALRQQQALVM